MYVQGQLSDLPRKSVEPMALAQGVPPRTLQQFLSLLDWNHERMRQRLQQIIAQSWYWIGGFCAPSDTTTNPATIPTATNAAFKRAVMVEHIG